MAGIGEERSLSGGAREGRGYSGSGGHVVAYHELESLDKDPYDFINAPQYVDFADIDKGEGNDDEAEADLFFENHREEDDFVVSLDCISPTVQFLQEGESAEFVKAQENSNTRISIVVQPAVGEEVIWNEREDDGEEEEQDNSAANGDQAYHEEEPEPVVIEHGVTSEEYPANIVHVEYIHDSEDEEEYNENIENEDPMNLPENAVYDYEMKQGKLRRVSSLSDLASLQLSISNNKTKRVQNTVGKITIPQSPDVTKRPPSKCRRTPKESKPAKGSVKSATLQLPTLTATSLLKGPLGKPPMKAQHYVSVAEAVQKFQKNTPDRFRTLPRGHFPLKRASSCELKPVSALRQRQVSKSPESSTTVTQKFRCRPSVAKAALSGPLAKSAIPRATVPQPFHFATARTRSHTTSQDSQKEEADFKFKAKPAPKLTVPYTAHERPQPKVTHAVAPHFASDDRIRERNVKKAQSASQSPTSTRPSSSQPCHAGKPNKSSRPSTATNQSASHDTHKPTILKPFSFDRRDQEMLRRKDEKIKKELEEANKIAEFRANPLPKLEPKLPKKKIMPVTNVEPFHLKSDERGTAYQEAMKKKLKEEERCKKEMATFHARPPIVLHQPAFEPEHPQRAPILPLDLHLSTEKRAAEREQFDQHIKEKEAELQRRREEEKARKEEIQRLQDMERRRHLVHKAQPFKEPKPFEIKASSKPLTVPESPAFNPLPAQRRFLMTSNTSGSSSNNTSILYKMEETITILLLSSTIWVIAGLWNAVQFLTRSCSQFKKE